MGKPILLVMAAGLASRYGSLKQMVPVGKNGEVLLDFASFDAIRAGFGKIVFIIRRDFEYEFRQLILPHIAKNIPVEIAFQESERAKPWGTVHAIVCAAEFIDAPFMVINADDFYGSGAFRALCDFAKNNPDEAAILPYKLANVLSDQGSVSRGHCDIKDGRLCSVEEMFKVRRESDGKIYALRGDGSLMTLDDNALVSMNCWLFPVAAMSLFQKYWADFIAENFAEQTKEFILCDAVMKFLQNENLQIRTVCADCEWFGMTYREDRDIARDHIERLINAGEYPETLWS
jgi:NDP-sugar pyrophosphorylase family protein